MKALPDLKEYSVLTPDMNYVYFEEADRFPLEPGKHDFSPVNAWWFSEFSFLVYCHPGFARLAAKLEGYDQFRFFQGKGTECMVFWNEETVVVAFRGTELNSLSTFHEIITDLNTIPTDFHLGGKVHRGFLKGLHEIRDGKDGLNQAISTLIKEKPDRPLWITGHSLGGALATLCFAETPDAAGLYVYGAPRVGDREFVALTEGRPAWRVEHGNDPIPMVPLDVPSAGFGFRDVGELVFIDRDGNLSSERPTINFSEEIDKVKSAIQDKRKKRTSKEKKELTVSENVAEIGAEIKAHIDESLKAWKNLFKNLDKGLSMKILDHMPIYYCIKLWNNLL
ncbi:MAG: lipase family protein [Spirochaetaceae bacterium]|nr:lipase family protein [Spirochaetaceae bacterium]